MKSVAFWASTALLVLGALSAVISMATLRWLYPARLAERPPDVVAPAPASTPPQVSDAPPAPIGPEEQLALTVLRLAGSGDVESALASTANLTAQGLTEQVARLKAVPLQAARLPGAGPEVPVLAWAHYTRDGARARGSYILKVSGDRVTGLDGPLSPQGGYKVPEVPLSDDRNRKIDLTQFRGRSLLLVSPRTPEPGLAETLADLERLHGPQGVTIVLVIDIRSPDWKAAARSQGFKGPVWLLKGNIESVPVINQGRLLGAVGLLIDRDGLAVSSLTALDPRRYGLADSSVLDVAPAVLRAYNLLP